MKEYSLLAKEKAYQLLNTGALILVSTMSTDQQYDIAPIAWQCPVDFDPVTKILFVTDKNHCTFRNIVETRQFIISIPHIIQVKLIKDVGSCSGSDTNKFEKFKIAAFKGNKINCLIPEEVIGFIECKCYNIVEDVTVAIVFGEVISASVDKEAYSNCLLSEKPEGKTLHHLSGNKFIAPGDFIIS
jgi:flavin reductase (DIM6/NTAB) family NADH-FMN oxidoreductase RutF